MAYVSDNFVRANGPLGGNWSAVFPIVPGEAAGSANSPGGGIAIVSNAYAPINAQAGDAYAIWAGAAFKNDQYAQAQISAIAPFTSVVHITAAVRSGNNTTYTYSLTSGNDLIVPQNVLITGMADGGNNGTFITTVVVPGVSFTVVNTNGVTRAAQSGTGNSPSDSNTGLVLRGSADGKNAYMFIAGTNSFNGDGRVYDREIWKLVNGVMTQLTGASIQPPIPDIVGDIYAFSAIGTTLTVYKNGVEIIVATDASLASGSPGIWTWSLSGANEYNYAAWVASGGLGATPPGNNGTQWTNFVAGDAPTNFAQLVSDTLLAGPTVSQLASDSFAYTDGDLHTKNANWVYQSGSFKVASNKVYCSAAAQCFAYRSDVSPTADQYAQITAVIGTSTGVQQCGPAVRVSAAAKTAYYVDLGTDGMVLIRAVNGVFTTLTSVGAGSAPVTGDVVAIYAIGSLIVVTKNGHYIMSATDANIASGNVGIYGFVNNTLNGASAWSGGNLSALYPTKFSVPAGQQFISDTTTGIFNFLKDGNAFASIYENTVAWPNDQYSQCADSGTTSSGVTLSGPAVRISTSADTGYYFGPDSTGNHVAIAKFVAGTKTVLNTVSYAYVQNDVFRIEAQGPLLIGKVNGAVYLTAVDSTIVSGKAGIISGALSLTTPTNTFTTWAAGQTAHGISGNAGVVGALVSWTGASSGSVTADGSGNYDTLQVLGNGNYTITPTKTGYTFSPVNSVQTINGADITGVNFTAIQNSTGVKIGFVLSESFGFLYQLTNKI